MSNKKSILITGGAGFVASNLIKIFLARTKFNITRGILQRFTKKY